MDFHTYAAQELSELAGRLAEAARDQTETATAHLTATFEANVERLRTDQSQLVSENERLTAENAALSWEKNELLDTARAASASVLVDRLLDVFERIARSTNVDDVLFATASGLGGEFGRVAVFKNGERIGQVGAETPLVDPSSSAVVPLPIIVRGESLAVIYGIDETRPNGDGARLAVLLRRHATLALDRLTTELKTISELRAYAQMLIDEVEYVFEADSAAHVDPENRGARLRENLRCARQIYQQRVTLEGPAAASVLEEMIRETLTVKASTLFGRELGALEAVMDLPSPA